MRQEGQMRERKTRAGAAPSFISETGQMGEYLRQWGDTGTLPFRSGNTKNRWSPPDSFVLPLEVPEDAKTGPWKLEGNILYNHLPLPQ